MTRLQWVPHPNLYSKKKIQKKEKNDTKLHLNRNFRIYVNEIGSHLILIKFGLFSLSNFGCSRQRNKSLVPLSIYHRLKSGACCWLVMIESKR